MHYSVRCECPGKKLISKMQIHILENGLPLHVHKCSFASYEKTIKNHKSANKTRHVTEAAPSQFAARDTNEICVSIYTVAL